MTEHPNQTTPRAKRKALLAGFSLVEMAVVVVIMGIMMALGLKTLRATQESAAWSETKAKQDRIKTALVSFLRTNGRLPCPDTAATPTGIETSAGCSTPATGYGVLPWATLGLGREAAVDGWQNFYTYRVATNNTSAAAPATPAVPRAQNAAQNWTFKAATGFNIGSLTSPVSGGFTALQIDQRDAAGGIAIVAYNAVAVVFSRGKTGGGARTPFGTVLAAPTGVDEIVNNTAGSTRFIVRDSTDNAAAIGGAYDDVVMFITPQDLLQPMLDDKTLKGVCSAYCVVAAAGCTAAGVPIGNPAPVCP
jgi:prepilin-type N-terminal cleavage/methylation domain-containing protein